MRHRKPVLAILALAALLVGGSVGTATAESETREQAGLAEQYFVPESLAAMTVPWRVELTNASVGVWWGPAVAGLPVGQDVTAYEESDDVGEALGQSSVLAASGSWYCSLSVPDPGEPRLTWISPDYWLQGRARHYCTGVDKHRALVQFHRSSWRGWVGWNDQRWSDWVNSGSYRNVYWSDRCDTGEGIFRYVLGVAGQARLKNGTYNMSPWYRGPSRQYNCGASPK